VSTKSIFLNFDLGELELGTHHPPFWFTHAGIEPRCRRWEPCKSCYRSICYYLL